MQIKLYFVLCFIQAIAWSLSDGIGYRIGNVTGYKLVKTYAKSRLFDV